jgi:hypothetical protein
MFLRNRLHTEEKHFVPNSFLERAIEHEQKTGQPLLYQRLPAYLHVLEAWEDGDGYTLNTPWDDWIPPYRTWREYASHKGLSAQEVMEEHELEEESQLDEEIDRSILDQLVEPDEGIAGEAAALLIDLPEYLIEDRGELATYLEETLLEVYENDGQYPGDPWTGSIQVSVRSKLALSVLQYVLDELGRGIKIQVES